MERGSLRGSGERGADREGIGAPLTVTLTYDELMLAALVGVSRQIRAMRKNRRQVNGADPVSFTEDIFGAAAEMAVAKAFNKYFPSGFREIDVGGEFEVRHSVRDDASLIVRQHDSDAKTYVLVTGIPPTLTIRGMIRGADAKKPEYFRAPNGRPGAYFVPQRELRDL